MPTTTTKAAVPTTTTTPAAPTTTKAAPTTTNVAASAPTGSAPSSAGQLQFAGVNIAGFDFGCDTNGDCTASAAFPPLTKYYGADGPGQMNHFVKDDGYNLFRLPVGWQFLTNNVATGTLNAANLAEYDQLMQACLGTGASCIIDIHNYARFNGQVIGQGGPSNDVFAQLWANLATKYAGNEKVIFGMSVCILQCFRDIVLMIYPV